MPQQTVIIIDEVQECPNILTFVKYLVQNDNYRFILTGSLLGTMLNNIDSLPVGYLTQIRMYPLDFEEFCWANGLSSVAVDMARSCLRTETPLPDFLYTRLSDLYHRYLMVGGMPDAVNTFLETNNIDEVRAIHKNLHALYRSDITKHAPKEIRLTLRDIYDLIPSEAASKSRRFRISDIKGVRRFSQAQEHFLWLSHAGVALSVYNVSAPASPLLLNERHNLFKLFYLDVGMLASSYPKKSYMGLLDGKPSMNMGGVYEAFVAQELKARGFALRYFTSKRLGELDFVVERTGGSPSTRGQVRHGIQDPRSTGQCPRRERVCHRPGHRSCRDQHRKGEEHTLLERFINNESHDPSCGITGRTRRREEGVSHGCDHHMPGARRG